MKYLIVLIALLSFSVVRGADSTQLQELLQRYPAADTNRDGILTFEEAQAHARVIRKGKKGPAAAGGNEEGPGAVVSKTKRPAPTHPNLSYGPHARNVLDLWLAKSKETTPLIVYIHGGGFVNGSKEGASADMINACLEAGVSFMAINYRYRTTAPVQDILRDCARSIQFVRSKAKDYNLDSGRIASYGGSAGAGTSLWLAFHPDLADPQSEDPILRQSSRIVAAGATNTQATYNVLRWPEFLGPADPAWDRPEDTPTFYGFTTRSEIPQPVLDDVDMLKLISRDDPPVFMFTAQPEGVVANRGHYLHHPNHARAVKKACDDAGVPATVWFAMTEPRLEGDYQAKLRAFLFTHLKISASSK